MRIKARIWRCAALLALVLTCVLFVAQGRAADEYQGTVADLMPVPSFWGTEWRQSLGGFVAENWSMGVPAQSDEVTESANVKVSREVYQVRAVGDRLYLKDIQDGDITYSKSVLLRVFIFESTRQCQGWWQLKYEGEHSNLYVAVPEEHDYVALDVKERPKRAGRMANVFFSVQQIGEDGTEDYLQIADEVAARVVRGLR